jgi:hypothetical protein
VEPFASVAITIVLGQDGGQGYSYIHEMKAHIVCHNVITHLIAKQRVGVQGMQAKPVISNQSSRHG